MKLRYPLLATATLLALLSSAHASTFKMHVPLPILLGNGGEVVAPEPEPEPEPAPPLTLMLQAKTLEKGRITQFKAYDFKDLLSAEGELAPEVKPADIVWSAGAGGLPQGYSWYMQGMIRGTPTAVTEGTDFEVVATYGDVSARQTYTLKVAELNLKGKQVASGNNHHCALTLRNTVACWGSNGRGQLGDGSTQDSRSAVEVVGLENVTEVFAVGDLSCAISGGAVACWGSASAVPGSTLTPTYVPGFAGVTRLGATKGGGGLCGLTASGGLKCLGYIAGTNYKVPTDFPGFSSGVSDFSLGFNGAGCVVANAGKVHCWGKNNYGQIGDGTQDERKTPVEVSGIMGGATAVRVLEDSTCAILNGGVKCWGREYNGALGNGVSTFNSQLTPVDVIGIGAGSGARTLQGAASTYCTLLDSGALKCWGNNNAGQTGNGNSTKDQVPLAVTVPLAGAAASHSLATSSTCAVTGSTEVQCWGSNQWGQIGSGNLNNFAITTPATVLAP